MTPVGWPGAVPDPRDPAFEERAVAWMLDQGPGEWRTEQTWTKSPAALAHRLTCDLDARQEGARRAYASARVALARSGVDVEEVLSALEREGAALAARIRELSLVSDELGRRQDRRA